MPQNADKRRAAEQRLMAYLEHHDPVGFAIRRHNQGQLSLAEALDTLDADASSQVGYARVVDAPVLDGESFSPLYDDEETAEEREAIRADHAELALSLGDFDEIELFRLIPGCGRELYYLQWYDSQMRVSRRQGFFPSPDAAFDALRTAYDIVLPTIFEDDWRRPFLR